ncbi:anti-virulence regulator CigR family protein [Pseudomonas sp. MWU16-30317]|uniref:anti-virulence regulator CigR family protein n=1 Tax=Pseudomonas sp. MWU16-30317 TaxID=2878095 RepID=UPI001CFAADC6|nr:anti-virulence regulator CigR family protein [Pseudomonas sp. MWU16-30317]
MKLPKPLIAAMGIVLVGVTPLLQAAPGPDDRGQGGGEQHQQGPQGQQGQQQQQNHGHQGGGNGAGHGNQQSNRGNQGGNRPPQDFGPVRQTISQNRGSFGRGNPLPPNIHVERGRPLPRGYGRPLDAGALRHLPHYDGYQWRRLGSDVVLVAIGTGLVYEILDNVLN